MKKLSLLFSCALLLLLTPSCKNEVEPEVVLTVRNTQGEPVRATVISSVERSNAGVINEAIIDTVRADQFGKAFFKFQNTVLVDFYVLRAGNRVDSVSVLAETQRLKRNEKNIYERNLTFK